MRVVAVVTARRSSRRLPGKVLIPLHGRPMLAFTLERLQSVDRLDEILIATSTDRSDDPVAAFARAQGTHCWRGPLDDVLGRVHGAATGCSADAVVRISADSPLIDPAVVRTAVELYCDQAPDLVTNVHPRSFPKGQSVEVLSLSALERLAREATQPSDREHVTSYAYSHSERFDIRNFCAMRPRPELQMSVDTATDLERAAALLSASNGGFPTVDRLIDLVDELYPAP